MHKISCAAVIAAGLLLEPAVSAAQTATFMLVPGIAGESTDDAHRAWIDIESLRQSWEQPAKGRAACVIDVGKRLDASGPLLWLAAVTGQSFNEIQIEAVRTGEPRFRFFQIKLTNAQIVSIATSGDDTYDEALRLEAETATLTYWPQGRDGQAGPSVAKTVSCGR